MLRTEELSFRYAGSHDWAAKDISLRVNRGECVVLAGPSGCGKSTLIKALCGLIPHFEQGVRAGRVLLQGVDLADLPIHQIAGRVGAVFQNPRSQFFTTEVAAEIAFGCENLGVPVEQMRRRVDRALERFSLNHLRGRTIFQLSNGQRQKVIIAALFAMSPEVWVLDEPSANLDPAATSELAGIIQGLKQAGKTLIIAEHRCHYLKSCADRMVLLERGRVVSVQPAAGFFSQADREINRLGLRWIHLPTAQADKPQTPASNGEHILEVRGLRHRYRGQTKEVLGGVDFKLRAGEIAAITGDNGAGKTTLAMIITGLIKQKAGEIRISQATLRPAQRIKHCRLVLQEADHQLFAESVHRELELSLAAAGDARQRINQLLAATGLGSLAHRHPSSLSGGEKQRLAIAVALAAEPDVLILDEPTSGLDAHCLGLVSDLLQGLARRGGLVLVVTHDYQFIHTCCHKVLRLAQGRVTVRTPREDMPAELLDLLADKPGQSNHDHYPNLAKG